MGGRKGLGWVDMWETFEEMETFRCNKSPPPNHAPIHSAPITKHNMQTPAQLTHPPSQQVQSGGSFDIDYAVHGPNDYLILDGQKERQGDFVFTANEVGEYRFCFDNEMSTVTDKTVDFEIAVILPFLPPSLPFPLFPPKAPIQLADAGA